MPITRDFIFQTDCETGLTGLTPLWLGDANPVQGIAHDVLEHRRTERGSPVTAELLALGAFLALRIENGAFYGGRSSAETMAFTIYEMLLELCRGKSLEASSPTRPLNDVSEWAEDLIQQAIPQAFDLLSYDDLDAKGIKDLKARHSGDLVAWLRKGYRHARRRYQAVDRYYVANTLFKKLDKASEDLIHQENLEEGDRVRVSVCLRRGDINFSVNGYPAFY